MPVDAQDQNDVGLGLADVREMLRRELELETASGRVGHPEALRDVDAIPARRRLTHDASGDENTDRDRPV